MRVVVLPHAGGAAGGYHGLSAELAAAHDVVVVQYPGRQDRWGEPLVPSLTELAARIAAALRAADDGRPVALFGHSMGATVAFEVARRIDGGPAALFVSARRAPSVPDDRRLHLLDDDALLADLRTVRGTDPRLLDNPEMRAMILAVVRNDYRAVDEYAYRPGEPLRCPVTAMVAVDDDRATVDLVRPWRDLTTGPFELHTFTGGHFFVNDRAAEVARVVREGLARC